MLISFKRNRILIERILIYKYFYAIMSLSFWLCVNVTFKFWVLKFFGKYYVTARYYIIVMLKVNTSYSFCIYVNVCVDKSGKSKREEKYRDVSPGDVAAGHPVATFYKSRSPGMFNLSKSWGRSQLQRPFVKIHATKLRCDDVAYGWTAA